MTKTMPAQGRVVSRAEWLVAHKALRAKEKAVTRARHVLNAARRPLPMVKIEVKQTPLALRTFEVDAGEKFGLSVFLLDGNAIFQTHFTEGRGDEYLGSVWTLLDLTPHGRQADREDSPDGWHGWPQTPPYTWWRQRQA